MKPLDLILHWSSVLFLSLGAAGMLLLAIVQLNHEYQR